MRTSVCLYMLAAVVHWSGQPHGPPKLMLAYWIFILPPQGVVHLDGCKDTLQEAPYVDVRTGVGVSLARGIPVLYCTVLYFVCCLERTL